MKGARLLIPRVYSAEYFGHKNKYVQKEKLEMYRAVHVCATDGCSGMIVEFAAMPIKNTNNTTKKTISNKTLNNNT